MVSDSKKKLVKDLVNQIKESPIIGVLNLENLPAKQLQIMRAMLRNNGVDIVMTRKRLIKRAFSKVDKKEIGQLSDTVKGMPALLFAKINPFSLYKTIQKNKSKAPAKAGQIAPDDIVVNAGPTNFAPGPIISELASVGIKTKVDGGKLAILSDTIVAKEGDEISAKLAETLKRLDIMPMQIGLDLVAVWENGTVFAAKQLHIDEQEYLNNFAQAAQWAMNLAIESAYPSSSTIELLLNKAFNDSKSISLEANFLTDVTASELLANVEREALALENNIDYKRVDKMDDNQVKEEFAEPEPAVEVPSGPDVVETAETPAETPAEETPAETPAEETPAEQPAEEAPAETPAEQPAEEAPAEQPAEQPAEEAPAETPAEETPAETPAEETPAEQPAEETPAETPAEQPAEETPAETPAEQPAEEAPAEETPAEQPAETPAEETPAEQPAETPAEETPAEQPAEEAPAETPAEQPAEETPAETPAEQPAEEAPAEETPAEQPAETPAEETPAEQPAEETPAEQPAETPAEQPAEEAPVEETQSAKETTSKPIQNPIIETPEIKELSDDDLLIEKQFKDQVKSDKPVLKQPKQEEPVSKIDTPSVTNIVQETKKEFNEQERVENSAENLVEQELKVADEEALRKTAIQERKDTTVEDAENLYEQLKKKGTLRKES